MTIFLLQPALSLFDPSGPQFQGRPNRMGSQMDILALQRLADQTVIFLRALCVWPLGLPGDIILADRGREEVQRHAVNLLDEPISRGLPQYRWWGCGCQGTGRLRTKSGRDILIGYKTSITDTQTVAKPGGNGFAPMRESRVKDLNSIGYRRGRGRPCIT